MRLVPFFCFLFICFSGPLHNKMPLFVCGASFLQIGIPVLCISCLSLLRTTLNALSLPGRTQPLSKAELLSLWCNKHIHADTICWAEASETNAIGARSLTLAMEKAVNPLNCPLRLSGWSWQGGWWK